MYIPAKILKSDTGEGEIMLNKQHSTFLTEKQFKRIKSTPNRLLTEMAEACMMEIFLLIHWCLGIGVAAIIAITGIFVEMYLMFAIGKWLKIKKP